MYVSITPPEWYRNVIFGGPGPWTISKARDPRETTRILNVLSKVFGFVDFRFEIGSKYNRDHRQICRLWNVWLTDMFWIILLTILWLLRRDGSVSEGLRWGLQQQTSINYTWFQVHSPEMLNEVNIRKWSWLNLHYWLKCSYNLPIYTTGVVILREVLFRESGSRWRQEFALYG